MDNDLNSAAARCDRDRRAGVSGGSARESGNRGGYPPELTSEKTDTDQEHHFPGVHVSPWMMLASETFQPSGVRFSVA